jgi:hypothetical protein
MAVLPGLLEALVGSCPFTVIAVKFLIAFTPNSLNHEL